MNNSEDEKESSKAVPLDLAKTQIATVKTMENKSPLVMTSQSLRGVRVLSQNPSNSNTVSLGNAAIITTNLIPQTVLKPVESNRTQMSSAAVTAATAQNTSGSSIGRPTQITFSPAPLIAQSTGTSYHVPRGPAVVANLAAPRSNVTTVRTPLVVTAQSGQQHGFVRPQRLPTAGQGQGTAWLTSSQNGSQTKGALTVLSSPVKSAMVTGKPQIIARTQPQGVTTIRPNSNLQSTITIGQSGVQAQQFKPGGATIQALGTTVAQVVPNRTQAVVYTASTTQFTPTTRITLSNTLPTPRLPQARITTLGSSQASARIVTTQPTSAIGRLSVAAAPTTASTANILGQTRISTLNLHSLVAVANTNQPRGIQTQSAKVITQPAQGTIHLTPLPATVKTTASVVTTIARTINIPSVSVNSQQQRQQTTVVPSQAISIAKVFTPSDSHATIAAATTAANIFIQQPAKRSSPSESALVKRKETVVVEGPSPTTCFAPTSSSMPSTTVATYTLASGTYFYDTTSSSYSVNRSFGNQQPYMGTQPQIRPVLSTQQVSSQQIRFNPVMVVDQQQQQQQQQSSQYSSNAPEQSQSSIVAEVGKVVTSSPRPSILRKRDHDGAVMLKAAKNLQPVLATLSNQQLTGVAAPHSPPSRPDSRGNGHSSGGSTTISATSSPGLAEVNEDSNHATSVSQPVKEEEETKRSVEMSPRKKPRKQQLTGNDLDENNDDMQFIMESTVKRENDDSDVNQSDETKDGVAETPVPTIVKPPTVSLLNSYKQNWKATHNHYLRHSDVKPKDERRPTIMDLANQYRVQEKINGWKIHHLTTQMEDLAEQEQGVYNQLTELLKCTENEENCRQYDKEINRVNELIKGNLQRIKIINDGMIEAKSQIMKIFDHKVHVMDIINRCASKRNFKKRDKS